MVPLPLLVVSTLAAPGRRPQFASVDPVSAPPPDPTPPAATPSPSTDDDLIKRGLLYKDTWLIEEIVGAPDGFPMMVLATSSEHNHVHDHGPFDSRHEKESQDWKNSGAEHINTKSYSTAPAFPGPEVIVRQGGRVQITVVNHLGRFLSGPAWFGPRVAIHWHGLHMTMQNWMDGTPGTSECGIPPGMNFTYDFTVDQPPGTHWWHSHAGSQFGQGMSGAIIILPKEGGEDPITKKYAPAYDQTVFVADWAHERYEDLHLRYNGRIFEYGEGLSDRDSFLPDYPYPAHSILIQGKGQFNCSHMIDQSQCKLIRAKGWPWYVGTDWGNNIEQTEVPPKVGGGHQCLPIRDSLFGQCIEQPEPAEYMCKRGHNVRLRFIGASVSLPITVWVDAHNFTVVAKDGTAVVPRGPYRAWFVNAGERYDVIVPCDQPEGVYKMFASHGRHYYPGCTDCVMPEAAYALLRYEGVDKGTPPVEPTYKYSQPGVGIRPPDKLPYDMTNARTPYANFVPADYGSWSEPSLSAMYLPTIDRTLRPLEGPKTMRPAYELKQVQVFGDGNWHSRQPSGDMEYGFNKSRDAGGLKGLPYEWWSVDGHKPFYAPREPVLMTTMMGLTADSYRSFGASGKEQPFILQMEYELPPKEPLVYEIVIVNHEGQQHPWHLHGVTMYVTGWGYLNPPAYDQDGRPECGRYSTCSKTLPNGDARPTYLDETNRLDYEKIRAHYKIPHYTEEAPVLTAGDTFTLPGKTFLTFRVVAENPGVWLAHCHMDYHLNSGMAFAFVISSTKGGDPFPGLKPAPADLPVCGEPATYGQAVAKEKHAHAEEENVKLKAELAALRAKMGA